MAKPKLNTCDALNAEEFFSIAKVPKLMPSALAVITRAQIRGRRARIESGCRGLGLKVDVDAVPPSLKQLKQGKVNLSDPAVTKHLFL